MQPSQTIPVGMTMVAAGVVGNTRRFLGQSGLEALSVTTDVTSPRPEAFRARLISSPLKDMTVNDLVSATRYVCDRTPDRVRLVPRDVVQFYAVQRGRFSFEGSGKRNVAEAGDVCVVLSDIPYRVETSGASRVVSVSISTTALECSPEEISPLSNTVLDPSPLVVAFSSFLATLATGVPHQSSVAARFVEQALLDLARALVSDASGVVVLGQPGISGLSVRMRDFVERNLRDSTLSVESLARVLGVSVRTVHRTFSTEGTTFAAFIRQRRVTQLADLLISRSESFEVLAGEVGFGSVDAAYRAFSSHFETKPATYRREKKTAQNIEHEARGLKSAYW